MRELEEMLKDYINCKNMNFYAVSFVEDQEKPNEKELEKEDILKQLKNHTYNISQVYKMLSEGKLTAADIAKHTSIDKYDLLMDELKDFDRKHNKKIKAADVDLDNKVKVVKSDESNSEEMISDLSKKLMDFLTDAKEILLIKK
ncbi:hypothetical protein B0P06_006069 [Clostridium saccharoperbutylacetonicum]|uniref:Uncharacterized protein n=1 Tax=Clostridium saccharoperbutylacetonicum N1-4(HMT) TaxID=931276 RepID=M1MYS8_9CLOT|nr:hypothetical protein [Clostridium saccharoperbutylacetonicum]AGF59656.1 hypothetical protein Cspa_135p00960 [Clostridium saccharoperbutylacetonicum N1-4(HMT)]NRT64594.1 hypothetical protein [Clostridium saccharoperbutylacetonicum]NSB28962.1 hypothetical protein [Clostridium saccharoperbutylacetonicum]NSB46176.1 hypothetical protein [Clostridium saccharoperbutylacetonicum]